LQAFVEENIRLYRVSYPVITGAAIFCGNQVRGGDGAVALNVAFFEPEYRAAARSALGIGDDLQVVYVVEGSAAWIAGLEPGDEIVAVSGRPIGTDAHAAEIVRDAFRAGSASNPVLLAVRRRNVVIEFVVEPERACAFDLNLVDSDEINAFADGTSINVTRGMLRFVSDDELAVIVAHELAHNAYGHVRKQLQNQAGGAMAGLLVDLLAAAAGVNTGGAFSRAGGQAGALTYAKDFEAEADYVALYMLAASDMPIDKAPYFWRRMATIAPGQIGYGTTHPTSPERFVAMERTIAEIDAKRVAGEPLIPTLAPE